MPRWTNEQMPNSSNGDGRAWPFETPHGSFAEQLTIHHGRVVPVKNPDLTDEQAAQIEPAAICFHAVRATAPRLGDVAVIPVPDQLD